MKGKIGGQGESGDLRIVLDGKVLAADHAVALEPLAAELLGGSLGGVGPLEGDAVVVRVLGAELEGLAGDGEHLRLLGVEAARRRVHGQALHVRRLDRPPDAVRPVVREADVVDVLLGEGRVVDDLRIPLRLGPRA